METETEYLEKIESSMNWRRCVPKRWDYETKEEYEEALGNYYDALEEDYEERRLNRDEDRGV